MQQLVISLCKMTPFTSEVVGIVMPSLVKSVAYSQAVYTILFQEDDIQVRNALPYTYNGWASGNEKLVA